MIIIMALLDMIGVASILPFMTVLTNPDIIETNTLLNQMYQISLKFGVENNKDFLFILGVIVFLLLVTSLFSKVLLHIYSFVLLNCVNTVLVNVSLKDI